MIVYMYSKTCVKLPFSKRPKNGFQDLFLLNAGQKYFRILQILQHFQPSLSYQLSLRPLFCLFLSDCFTPILPYQLIYFVINTCYTFFSLLIGGSLELVKEIFQEVKPGLSSYAEDPMQVK